MKLYKNHLPDAINASPSLNFVQIPNSMLRTKDLTFKAKGLLSLLLTNTDGWISFIETIKDMAKEGTEAISSGLKELEEHGYLWRIQYRNKDTKTRVGSFWAYTTVPGCFQIKEHLEYLEQHDYEVWMRKDEDEWKIKIIEEIRGEKPKQGNPDMAFQDLANPGLRITINKNTKDKNKNTISENKQNHPSSQDIVKLWNHYTNNTPISKIIKLSSSREKHLRARIKDLPSFKEWRTLIKQICSCPFLTGDNDRNWIITFDWMLNETNFTKILEGNYFKERKQSQPDTRPSQSRHEKVDPNKYAHIKPYMVIDNTQEEN